MPNERIVIPVIEDSGLESRLSEHFGRAPYFMGVEIDSKGEIVNVEAVPNTSEHFGGFGRPPDKILQLKPTALITYGMGPRALSIFQQARVAVLRANAPTVREVVEAFKRNELEELTEGCREARHSL
ncbi:dinitrogenase iron-molybdenum cofactor [Candidatus Bathyarchaeota archaeon]|nr:MAG: dinitrogenase iron-molybdenum cofactor [Candidatus Bathyarchaeota archaeon]